MSVQEDWDWLHCSLPVSESQRGLSDLYGPRRGLAGSELRWAGIGWGKVQVGWDWWEAREQLVLDLGHPGRGAWQGEVTLGSPSPGRRDGGDSGVPVTARGRGDSEVPIVARGRGDSGVPIAGRDRGDSGGVMERGRVTTGSLSPAGSGAGSSAVSPPGAAAGLGTSGSAWSCRETLQ